MPARDDSTVTNYSTCVTSIRSSMPVCLMCSYRVCRVSSPSRMNAPSRPASHSYKNCHFQQEVVKVVQLILVMPATTAVSEGSFSTMRRTKSYLRSTMHQDRLNHLMTLHIYQDKLDNLDLISVANEFVT